MMYSYPLSEDDIQHITACSRKRLDKFPYPHIVERGNPEIKMREDMP